MPFMIRTILLLTLIVSLALAQTTTVTIDGTTLIQVATFGADGRASTTVISTIAATSPTATQADPASDDGNPGHVGEPGSLVTGTRPTPFTYSTIVNGETLVRSGVFTPAPYSKTTDYSAPNIGTIWDYSEWVASYGPTTTAGRNAASPINRVPMTNGPALGFFASALVALGAGGWILL